MTMGENNEIWWDRRLAGRASCCRAGARRGQEESLLAAFEPARCHYTVRGRRALLATGGIIWLLKRVLGKKKKQDEEPENGKSDPGG